MPLIPIDQRTAKKSRAGVWALLKERGKLTVKEACLGTGLGVDTVRDYLNGLSAAGYVKKTRPAGGRPGVAIVYELVKSTREAPRVRKDGTPVSQGRARQQMWRIIKVSRQFTAKDVAVDASLEDSPVSRVDAKYYLRYLALAGYLRVVRRGRGTGAGGSPTEYRLLPGRYTGPKAPMIQRVKQVYDPNTGEVVWRQGGDK